MKPQGMILVVCCAGVLFTTGCLVELSEAIGEAIGDALGEAFACGIASAFPSDGVSHPGEVESYYVLKDDSQSRPLMNGTSGDIQFFDFTTVDSIDVEDETVLEISKLHIEEDRCGVMAHIETIGVGTTAITFEDKSGNSHTWQIRVAQVVGPPRIVSSRFGVLVDGETLELSKNDSVDIEVEVVDDLGEALAFLVPAYWSIEGADGIVDLKSRFTDEDETDSTSMPVTSRVNVLARETGETIILVEINGLEARFLILVTPE